MTGDSVEYVAIGNLIFDIDKTDGTWGSNSIAMIYRVEDGSHLYDGDVLASVITRSGDKMNVTVDKLNNADVTDATQLYGILGQAVTYRVVNGDYEFRTLRVDNTAGYSDFDTSATAYAEKNDEYDGVDIHDDAVVFVYDDNGTDSTSGNANKYIDNYADVLTGAELKRASLPSGASFVLVTGTTAKDPYLTAKDAGFNYVFCMSVAADLDDLTTVGGNFGYLLSDAWETTVDDTYYRVFNLWTENGQKTAYEETGDTYKYPSGTVIRYELLSTDGDNIYIRSVEDADPIQGKVEARDGNFVGIDGNKLELVNDSVVMNVDTVKKEGISYGDEARADIPLADTTAAGKVNALYLEANDEIVFLLIDTANIEIVDNFDLRNPDATALRDALEAADEDNETVTVEGSVPAGTFTVPAGVKLILANGATVAGGTTITGDVDFAGTVNVGKDGVLTVPAGEVATGDIFDVAAGGDVVLVSGGAQYSQKAILGNGAFALEKTADGWSYTVKSDMALAASFTIGATDLLTIANGAELDLDGKTLTVNGDLVVSGTLNADASGDAVVLNATSETTVEGTFTWSGSGSVTTPNDGARIRVMTGATCTATGASVVANGNWYVVDSGSWTAVS